MAVDNEIKTQKESKLIDVDNVILSKSPTLHKWLPKFVVNKLKKIIHQDEINDFISRNRHLYGHDFVNAIITEFGADVDYSGIENINENKRYIIASNHPLGGLDGIALLWVVGKKNKNIVFPVNDLLMYLDNLSELFIPINKHGSNKDNVKIIEDTFASDKTILYFPAGLCSRKQNKVICDLTWKKTFIKKAVTYKRDIIPCYINAANSKKFYNIASLRKKLGIKANIEMIYLPDEMYKQKGKHFSITFGSPIPYSTFDNRYNDTEWAQKVKEFVYSLKTNPDGKFMQ
ncbi:MAG: 1-acyl-sn-glycerol-3-phosphate acyltransferase [Bacteroidales bacterium]|jgi:1-acyl-sn-glycerol-3-phosphate acyltransferase